MIFKRKKKEVKEMKLNIKLKKRSS